MSELSEKEMEEIATLFVNKSMRIGKRPDGRYEAVRIMYNNTDPTCEKFAFKVEEECWKVGAHTLLLTYSSKRRRLRYTLTPDESLAEMSPLREAIVRKADVRISIGLEDDPNWALGITHKVRLQAPILQKLRAISDRRKVRWAFVGWPLPEAASFYGLPIKEFRKIFFESIRATFTKEVLDLCNYYRQALEGKDKVKIVADDGTDLSFRIKGRHVLVADGIISDEDLAAGDVGLNIPDGEVFIAPLETTANGRIFFESVVIPGFGRIKGLWLKFKDGKVVEYEAEEGANCFKQFLDANTGEKDRIAELGIGCNPGASYTGGAIIVDEKIFKTIHIAIGHNRGAWRGRNKASSHLDMIKDMSRGQLIVDGIVVMEKGKPVKTT